MRPAPEPERQRRLYVVPPDEDRRSDRSHQPVNPLLLAFGVLGGPVAFGSVRLAEWVLISQGCLHPAGSADGFGLSSPQLLMALFGIVGALMAGLSGIVSWHIWRGTSRGEEIETGESTRSVPFWALGGVFLSAVFFVLIVLTGALAVGLSTTCAS